MTARAQGRDVIEFQQASKSYRVGGRDIWALAPTDLGVAEGEVFGLIGHSGAGKSTLLRLINRLEEPTGGRIHVDGRGGFVCDRHTHCGATDNISDPCRGCWKA